MMESTFQNIEITNALPKIEDIEFSKIEKSYLKVLYLRWSILLLLLVTAYFLFILRMSFSFSSPQIIIGAIGLGGLICLLIYFKLSFKTREYAVRSKDISYQNGLLFHAVTTVPFTRIQHIEIGEGPLERVFDLATLNIFTAGDNGKDLRIRGLSKAKAMEIKAFITNEING